MFSKIIELKTIREQKSKLTERERELTEPMLDDLSLIEKLYEWFNDLSVRKKENERMLHRKEFIFIILCLYSPSTLAGGKMKIGLRDKLCEVLDINERSTLSKNLNNLAYHYQIYKYFRQDINSIYVEIVNRLREKKLIE